MIMLQGESVAMITRTTLKNGVPVLFMAYPKMNRVAVESFYRVGIVNEEKGMTQAAHLLEHLLCYGATKTYKAGESFGMLNRKGMANAETMGGFTHYDYVLPSSDLELALKIEADRLSSLKITKELILQEAPRCHSEAVHVENVPQAGMFKFGIMAINQAWQYGAMQTKVRSGLESITVANMRGFYFLAYRPYHLSLVIVGGFQQEQALQLLNKHLGSVKPTVPDIVMRPVNWTRMPKDLTMHWDSQTRAVCVAFPPPTGMKERFAMTLWGQVLMMRTFHAFAPLSHAYICTNTAWSAGELPFFLYASAKPGVELSALQQEMLKQLNAAIATPLTASEMAQFQMMVNEIEASLNPDGAAIQVRIQQMKSMAGNETRAADMVLGNLAIQVGMYELLFGNQRQATLNYMSRLKPEELHNLIKRTLNPAKRSIVRLVPV
jgi:predicted Zn-dependent peptidase